MRLRDRKTRSPPRERSISTSHCPAAGAATPWKCPDVSSLKPRARSAWRSVGCCNCTVASRPASGSPVAGGGGGAPTAHCPQNPRQRHPGGTASLHLNQGPAVGGTHVRPHLPMPFLLRARRCRFIFEVLAGLIGAAGVETAEGAHCGA